MKLQFQFCNDFVVSRIQRECGFQLCASASIRACWSLSRHMVALEPNVALFEEILVPLLPISEEKEIDSRHKPSPAQQEKQPSHVDDDEVEKKSAPKRECE